LVQLQVFVLPLAAHVHSPSAATTSPSAKRHRAPATQPEQSLPLGRGGGFGHRAMPPSVPIKLTTTSSVLGHSAPQPTSLTEELLVSGLAASAGRTTAASELDCPTFSAAPHAVAKASQQQFTNRPQLLKPTSTRRPFP
jgi:hypothetical protein